MATSNATIEQVKKSVEDLAHQLQGFDKAPGQLSDLGNEVGSLKIDVAKLSGLSTTVSQLNQNTNHSIDLLRTDTKVALSNLDQETRTLKGEFSSFKGSMEEFRRWSDRYIFWLITTFALTVVGSIASGVYLGSTVGGLQKIGEQHAEDLKTLKGLTKEQSEGAQKVITASEDAKQKLTSLSGKIPEIEKSLDKQLEKMEKSTEKQLDKVEKSTEKQITRLEDSVNKITEKNTKLALTLDENTKKLENLDKRILDALSKFQPPGIITREDTVRVYLTPETKRQMGEDSLTMFWDLPQPLTELETRRARATARLLAPPKKLATWQLFATVDQGGKGLSLRLTARDRDVIAELLKRPSVPFDVAIAIGGN